MIGTRLGAYVLQRQIGVGGMGTVYAADHGLLRRPAAVKILLPEFSVKPVMIQRFLTEARAAAAIKHPGVVEIYDVGYTDNGVAYLAMELLDGENLGERMSRGPIERSAIFAIVRQIASALAAAHRKRVVHRDLKPDNVFLLREEEASDVPRCKILDFGVAKMLTATDDPQVTGGGTIIGTPSYMSPEQCRCIEVDHRADLYSVGCILFALLTGHPPFRGQGMGDVLAAHIHAAPPRLSTVVANVPEALDALVTKLLAKRPEDRPQSAAELVDVLAKLEADARAAEQTARMPPPPADRATEPMAALPVARVAPPTPPAKVPAPTPPRPAAPPLPRMTPPPASPAAPPGTPRVASPVPPRARPVDPDVTAPMPPLRPLSVDADLTMPMPPRIAEPDPDITLPTGRIEIPDDAPTKKIRGIAEIIALADARFGPRAAVDDQVTTPRPRVTPGELAGAAAPPRSPPSPPASAPAEPDILDEPRPPRARPSPTTLASAAIHDLPAAPLAPARGRPWVMFGVALLVSAVGVWLLVRGQAEVDRGVVVTSGDGGAPTPATEQDAAASLPPTAAPPDAGSAPAPGASADDPIEMADERIALTVTTQPPGATVYVDGIRAGRTPYAGTIGARPTTVVVKVRLDGYHSEAMTTLADRPITWPVTLTAKTAAEAATPEPDEPPPSADAPAGSAVAPAALPVGIAPPPRGRTRDEFATELAARQKVYEADPQAGQLLKLGDAAVGAGQQSVAIKYYQRLIQLQPRSRDAAVAQQRLDALRRAIAEDLARAKAQRDQPAPSP